MAQEAFDLAEQFQTPVFVMMDLDLGMNNWMSDGVHVSRQADQPRQACSTPEKLKELGEWGRYKDVDGDGIPYRTIPGDGMPAYFTRGSGHNAKGQYSERPDDYVENMDRLSRKFETARTHVPQPVVETVAEREDRLHRLRHVALGDHESRDQLREETDVKTSYFRLRAYPFTDELGDVHRRARARLRHRAEPRRADAAADEARADAGAAVAKLRSVLHYSGLPIDARSITDDVLAQEGFEVAKKTAARGQRRHDGWGIDQWRHHSK